ncbi:MAG TPA: tRNA pseudouridine(55) synthase TruB [Victivallales bacterium]|nr:tRNA pseudouridine(55) synthase TruB [Victivallales bacterium]
MGRKNHPYPPFMESGILLVDKPEEWTSHDVVSFVRSRFNIKKVGHCGTLDPAATGLLILVLGKATKISQRLSSDNKTYSSTMLLGTETDSQDMDGKVTATNDYSNVTPEAVSLSIKKFVGNIMQIPPMVSAKKIDGKRLYKLAREGKEVERAPVPITIHSIEINSINIPHIDFTVSCSKGTYIRTLCHDIGKDLGCGAALFKLRRTHSGIFNSDASYSIPTIKEWTQEDLAKNILWTDNIELINILKKDFE